MDRATRVARLRLYASRSGALAHGEDASISRVETRGLVRIVRVPTAAGQAQSMAYSSPALSGATQVSEIAAASLSMDCGVLFLSVSGTTSGGAEVAGTVTCATP